ncbi:MAG: hypothetical protein ACOY35_13500 [Bacillota bacterium]
MNKIGKQLALFYPGEVTGCYAEGEGEIQNIASALGGYAERVFDMYLEFSRMADEGILIREERPINKRHMGVSFYYPFGLQVAKVRQRIINTLLSDYLNSAGYPKPGIYVMQDRGGNLALLCKAQIKNPYRLKTNKTM